ncbi:PASTA domain-containing protein [Hamadaea tsunoensis]|uniref:PASTA domain-containing protein n=1 Tax=Hamadaea tsunoensis TaxID=53368 RepID=UPI000404099F|nr:PASTA domain-containing protein [Hamadaea tsunoensis]
MLGIVRRRPLVTLIALVVLVGVAYGGGSLIAYLQKHPRTTPLASEMSTGPSAPAQSPSPSPSPLPSGYLLLPDLSKRRAPDAQSMLSLLGFKVNLQDSSGAGRLIVDPANWIVDGQDPPADSAVAIKSPVTLKVHKPTDGKGDQKFSLGVMPNVVCKNLQDAYDALHKATYFNIGSKDASGANRLQLLTADWIVVGQSETAGKKPGLLTHITLTVVKYNESTGDSGCES